MKNEFNFNNVLFVGPDYIDHRGGIGAVIASYASVVAKFNFLPTYNGRYGKIRNFLLFIWFIPRLFTKLIFNKAIKIVHIHSASKGSFFRKFIVFFICKFFFRKKVVFHLHGGAFHRFYLNNNKFTKLCVVYLTSNVDLFICLSDYWASFLNNYFVFSKLIILKNPISYDDKEIMPREDSNVLNFLYLGRICTNKGVFDLLNVIVENKEFWVGKVKFKIGGYDQVDRLKTLIHEHGLESIVDFVGWVSGDVKNRLLNECDALILPSYDEGLPICILEAMSKSKVILATEVGGIPDIVKHGENGFLYKPGDQNRLKQLINYFLELDLKDIEDMGNNSLKIVYPYKIENVVLELQNQYNNLLKNEDSVKK